MRQTPAPSKHNRFGSWITVTSYHKQRSFAPSFILWYSISTLAIYLTVVRSVLHCKNVSKERGNTCSPDTSFFFLRQELWKKFQHSHLDFSLLCTKRTLFSFTSLQLKWSPLLSCTSFPFTTITSLPLEGGLSIWNKSCPVSPSRPRTPSKERSRGSTPPIPTVRVPFTWKLEGCLLTKKKEGESITEWITAMGCVSILPVTTIFWITDQTLIMPCSLLT